MNNVAGVRRLKQVLKTKVSVEVLQKYWERDNFNSTLVLVVRSLVESSEGL